MGRVNWRKKRSMRGIMGGAMRGYNYSPLHCAGDGTPDTGLMNV